MLGFLFGSNRENEPFTVPIVVRGRRVAYKPAIPMKRARKAAGVRGRKAAKRFRRAFRAAH